MQAGPCVFLPGGVVAASKSMLQLEDELLKKGGSSVMGVGPRMAQPGLARTVHAVL